MLHTVALSGEGVATVLAVLKTTSRDLGETLRGDVENLYRSIADQVFLLRRGDVVTSGLRRLEDIAGELREIDTLTLAEGGARLEDLANEIEFIVGNIRSVLQPKEGG